MDAVFPSSNEFRRHNFPNDQTGNITFRSRTLSNASDWTLTSVSSTDTIPNAFWRKFDKDRKKGRKLVWPTGYWLRRRKPGERKPHIWDIKTRPHINKFTGAEITGKCLHLQNYVANRKLDKSDIDYILEYRDANCYRMVLSLPTLTWKTFHEMTLQGVINPAPKPKSHQNTNNNCTSSSM